MITLKAKSYIHPSLHNFNAFSWKNENQKGQIFTSTQKTFHYCCSLFLYLIQDIFILMYNKNLEFYIAWKSYHKHHLHNWRYDCVSTNMSWIHNDIIQVLFAIETQTTLLIFVYLIYYISIVLAHSSSSPRVERNQLYIEDMLCSINMNYIHYRSNSNAFLHRSLRFI